MMVMEALLGDYPTEEDTPLPPYRKAGHDDATPVEIVETKSKEEN